MARGVGQVKIRSVCSLWVAFVFGAVVVLFAGGAGAAMIEGSVVEAGPEQVKIQFDAPEAPQVGDFVDLVQEDTGGKTTVTGTWRIVRVENKVLWVEALDGAPGPVQGTKAYIYAGSGTVCAVRTAQQSKDRKASPAVGEASLRQGGSDASEVRIQQEVVASFRAAREQLGAAPLPVEQKSLSERGWLGVTLQMVTREMASAFGMAAPQGALVASVFSKGPAENAGFEQDDVILNFNGTNVSNCHIMPDLLASMPPGQEVTVVLWRAGKLVTRKVVMGMQPRAQAQSVPNAGEAKSGATLAKKKKKK